MRYKCLVLDHDDTAVKSTSELHYPAFRIIMDKIRPGYEGYDLKEFTRKCFYPGFADFCRGELGFTDEEMDLEYRIWKEYIKDKTPDFYDGFLDTVKKFRNNNGYICIVSHSDSSEIKRHYAENGIVPDLVYGWELPEHKRKPDPYPLMQILKKFSLRPEEAIVVDDLRLGYDMARACGVEFAAAGWSHGLIPEITDFMKAKADYYFDSVAAFSDFIFEG